jgi:hypothetical protein
LTKKQKDYFQKLAEYGCIICRRPAQIHHCGTHIGGGRDHEKVIPLCVEHHTGGGYGVAIHAGKKEFEEKFGTEDELLIKIKMIFK